MLIGCCTSFPDRINTLHEVLLHMMHQDHQLNKIIVTLSSDQFPNKEDSLPENLLRLVNQLEGYIELNWVKRDLKTFKKFLPIVLNHLNDEILTFDDDVLYPPYYVKCYWDTYCKYNKRYSITLDCRDRFPCSCHGRGSLYKPGIFKYYQYYINEDIISTRHDDRFYDNMLFSRGEYVVPVLGFIPSDLDNYYMLDYKSGWQSDPDWYWNACIKVDSYFESFMRFTNLIDTIENKVEFPEFDKNQGTNKSIIQRSWDHEHLVKWDNWDKDVFD